MENAPDAPFDKHDPLIKATMAEILKTLTDISIIDPTFKNVIEKFPQMQDYGDIANLLAAFSNGHPMDMQAVLESETMQERLSKTLFLMKNVDKLNLGAGETLGR